MNDESYSEDEESSSTNRCLSRLFLSPTPEWEVQHHVHAIYRIQYIRIADYIQHVHIVNSFQC